jgi:glutamate formiminotransferase
VPLFEIVPNLSEGRDPATIDSAAGAVERSGARLLDRSSDPTHHRSVLTIVGDADQVVEAGIGLAGVALERIDLRGHKGVHPRIGALDVLPFVPLEEASLADAAALAHRAGAEIWKR